MADKSGPLRELAAAIGDELGPMWGQDRAMGGKSYDNWMTR